MTNVLVYWRDYLRNLATEFDGCSDRCWHSSSRVMGSLETGDRIWLVSAGQTLGRQPKEHGFLVEVWQVLRVMDNPGDMEGYPRERYRYRVVAGLDPQLNPGTPIEVDAIIRPEQSSRELPIGRLLQGPRRLPLHLVDQLWHLSGLAPLPAASRRDADHDKLDGAPSGIDPGMIALGIRQPWAELILRGIKSIEVRTLETTVRGPVYLYTSKLLADGPASQRMIARCNLPESDLPLGRIVGQVEIIGCRPCTRLDVDHACVPTRMLSGRYAWELANPQRLDSPLTPRFLPYGMWFYPFRRRSTEVESAAGES
ncbi:MAG: ASCH domain-containing protein [Planctomycetaceae bacterium]